MKKAFLVLFCFNVLKANSQIIKGIGFDLGDNIVPQLAGYQGFGGNIFVKISNKKNKNLWVKFGYDNFKKLNNTLNNGYYESKFDQKNAGFYGIYSKEIGKYTAWQVMASVYDSYSTLRFRDKDFDAFYEYERTNKATISLGAGLTARLPIKINKNIQTEVQAMVSLYTPFRFKGINQLIYIPGAGPSFSLLGFNMSVPIVFNLNTKP
jgi:hypothetical protein